MLKIVDYSKNDFLAGRSKYSSTPCVLGRPKFPRLPQVALLALEGSSELKAKPRTSGLKAALVSQLFNGFALFAK